MSKNIFFYIRTSEKHKSDVDSSCFILLMGL